MADIHSTAIVDPAARIADDVSIGPFTVVGPHVELGAAVKLHAHVVIDGHTTVGEGTEIFPFASVGLVPQDKKFRGEMSRLEIGAGNVIREYVTMNPGTEGGGGLTRIGAQGLYMVGAHVAHDCIIGDHVILANNASVAGHCVIGDHAILGGLSGVHQFVRIGAQSFVAALAGLEQDLIPYGMALGNRASLTGLNITGLKRRGFSREQIHELRRAYRMLFEGATTVAERADKVADAFSDNPAVGEIVAFVKAPTQRALCVPKLDATGE